MCASLGSNDLIYEDITPVGGHHSIYRRGGGCSFCRGQIIFSTRPGRALKITNCITCLYRTLLHVNYLFHAESARNYLFKKKTKAPSPAWRLNGGPRTYYILQTQAVFQKHCIVNSVIPISMKQCCFISGPPFTTLAQHWNNISCCSILQ